MKRPGRAAARARRSSVRVASFGTLVVHGIGGGLLFGAPRSVDVSAMQVYTVELVAAPRPRPDQRKAPEALERPADRPAPVATRRPRRTAVSEETPPPADQPQIEREPAARTTPEVAPAPDVEPSTGSDIATLKTTGVEFPFPGYLRNVVAQIYRRWRRPLGNVALRAEILFFIKRDGSVSNLQFVQRSGNFGFDLEAQGAIEAAANGMAFGALPEGYQEDVLPVSFFFDPSTARR